MTNLSKYDGWTRTMLIEAYETSIERERNLQLDCALLTVINSKLVQVAERAKWRDANYSTIWRTLDEQSPKWGAPKERTLLGQVADYNERKRS